MQTINRKQHEAMFAEFSRFYDLADDVIASIEDVNAPDAEFQAVLASPVIEQVSDSVEKLENCYAEFVNKNGITKKTQGEIQSALQGIMESVLEFLEEIKAIPGVAKVQAAKAALNIKKTSAIIQKLVAEIHEVLGSSLVEAFRVEAGRISEFKKFIESVMNIGVHSMLVTRALKSLGLVAAIELIEPAKKMARIFSMQHAQSFAARLAKHSGQTRELAI